MAAIALLLCAGPAAAQLLQGTIVGNVVDPSKAAIPNATVTAENLSTHFTRTTTTNSAGEYTFPDLPPGTYAVTVSARGFQTYTRTDVVLTVQTVVRVDATMVVGQTKQTVLVTAAAEALQTDRADVHTELSGNLLANLPLPVGRNYEMIFTTLPGSSPPQVGHSFTANPARSFTFNVNGGDVEADQTFVDGAGTRAFNAADIIQYIPSLASIANVSVATSSFEGDQSAGGAFVNVTVKSGTNDVHGSLFEDVTQQGLQAYAWGTNHALPKAPFIDNQFGGTIGGPIKKNKLFYFASYQGERLVEGNTVLASVPTAAMKAGDLSASPTPIYNPLTGNSNGSDRTPFPGNIIPASMIDPGIQKMLNTGAWPNPNTTGTGSLHIGNDFLCTDCVGNADTGRNQVDSKVNWDPTSKLSTFVRFGLFKSTWNNPQIFGILGGPGVSPDNGAVGTGSSTVYNDSASMTYVFTPTLLVDAFVGYDRYDGTLTQPYDNENLGWTVLGIPGLDTAGLPPSVALARNGMPALTLSGFSDLGIQNDYTPYSVENPEDNFNANINWLKGAHSFRAGFSGDIQHSDELQYESATGGALDNPGEFEFEDGTTQLLNGPGGNDLNSLASMLLGLPQDEGTTIQNFPRYYTREKNFGVYVMDRWQMTPRLTLTPGLRFDYMGFPTRSGTGFEFYDVPNSDMLICGKATIPTNCGITKGRNHVDPTIGLAYRLTKSTVIRAGYSKAMDPILFYGHFDSDRQNFPYITSLIVEPPNSYSYSTTLRQGLPTVAVPDIASGVVPVNPLDGVNTLDNADYVHGYSQTWNFALEQGFAGFLASVAYVGMRQIDPINNLELNWSPIGGGTAGQQEYKYNERTAYTGYLGTLGTNTYDGLQTSLRRQFRSGYQLITNFTWSKAMGYANSPYVVIPQYFGTNYGPQSFNFPYLFSVTGIAPLPFGPGRSWLRTGFASKLAGGWQLSGILTEHSGYDFTAEANGSTLNSPESGQYADCISPAVQTGNHMEVYNTDAFAAPASGLGTCGTDSLMGPSDFDLDLDLQRQIRISERFRLKIDADMFNATNRPNFGVPSDSVNTSTFMEDTSLITATTALDQRNVRFDVELDW